MKRRELFASGAALAAVSLASAASATPNWKSPGGSSGGGSTSTAASSPTVFDYGAVGDGVTDDSAAFSQALQAAAAQGLKVIVPGATYAIAQPIVFASNGNATRLWGLECEGAVLKSSITTGEDVISMTSTDVVRYFQVGGGLTIKGSGSDGRGLHIFAPGTGGAYFYNCTLDSLSVEGVGGDGLLFEGNVFESQVSNSFFQNCGRNGATFAHSQGGACSSINLIGCYFNQNARHGMEATNFDGRYGGATDVRVFGGYCRENGHFGFRYNNGTAQGAQVTQVGFENNCTTLAPGDPSGAHVYADVRMQMSACAGYNEFGGATNLLRGWFSDLALLDGCSQTCGGAMASTGKSRLVRVNGSSDGFVLMRGCNGGVAAESGTACTWRAENCKGPSPLGALSLKDVVVSA